MAPRSPCNAACWFEGGPALIPASGSHGLAPVKVGGVLQSLQHLAGVGPFVGLGAQGPNGRAAVGVEDALLQGGGIGEAADQPAEGSPKDSVGEQEVAEVQMYGVGQTHGPHRGENPAPDPPQSATAA
jgi:hypothetical protein